MPGCGSHFSATCTGFNCPPIPWCLRGTVSASPAPQGLWTEASPDLGVSPPAHSSQGPRPSLAHGQAHVAEFILDDLWWDKTFKREPGDGRAKNRDPALTIRTKARSGPAASMQIKTQTKGNDGRLFTFCWVNRRFLRMTPRPGTLKITLINLLTEREKI